MAKKSTTEKVIASLQADIAVKEQELAALRHAVKKLEIAHTRQGLPKRPPSKRVNVLQPFGAATS